MGKTADVPVVWKMIIDTFHKEGKPQKVIAKEPVRRVLYPNIITVKWKGEVRLEKRHK